MKKQVLLLSVLVWGLVIFAPFTGDGGFSLTPWFDAAVSGTPADVREPMHAMPPSLAHSFDAVTPLSAAGEYSIHPESDALRRVAVSLEQKSNGPGSEPVYLSYQECPQQVTHTGIQGGGIQGSCSSRTASSDGENESSRQNREQVYLSRHGGETSGWPETPRGLPPATGNEGGRQHEPGNVYQHSMRSDEVTPGSPFNDCKPPLPGGGPSPSDVNSSFTL